MRVCSSRCFVKGASHSNRELPKTDAFGKENTCPAPVQQLRPCLGLASGQRLLLLYLQNTQRARDFPGDSYSGTQIGQGRILGSVLGLQSSPGLLCEHPDTAVWGGKGWNSTKYRHGLLFLILVQMPPMLWDWGGG